MMLGPELGLSSSPAAKCGTPNLDGVAVLNPTPSTAISCLWMKWSSTEHRRQETCPNRAPSDGTMIAAAHGFTANPLERSWVVNPFYLQLLLPS